MTSRRARLLGAALPLVAAAAACGCSSVHDANVPGDPLLVVHGHVDTTALVRTNPNAPLIGALVWATVPAVNPVCVRFPNDPTIQGACPDPQGVFLGEIEVTAPIAPDGSFDLDLFHLPAFSNSVGDSINRVAYGSILVAEDVNGDGNLDLIQKPSGDRGGPGMENANPDRIVAASFSSLNAHQERLVFLEGAFIPPCLTADMMPPACSYYYPSTCIDPAAIYRNFSVMTTDPGGACADVPLPDDTAVIEAAPLASAADGLALNCRSIQGSDVTVHAPPADGDAPPGSPPLACPAPKIVAAVYQQTCSWLRAYALSGCAQDPLCASPEWTTTTAPPWWPPSCM